MKKDLDTLLVMHFHRQPDITRLNGLEDKVLRTIRQQHSGNVIVLPLFSETKIMAKNTIKYKDIAFYHLNKKVKCYIMQWLDDVMVTLSVPQFRFASLGLALCIGLAVSIVVPPAKSDIQLAYVNHYGMNLFAMNASYLPSSRFEHIAQDIE